MSLDDWQPLSPTTACVWWLPLDGTPDDRWNRWIDVLEADERDRARRFVHDRDRHTYIAAHALLRLLLQLFDGRPALSWRFVSGARGKPSLHPDHGLPRLTFNISHTHGAVACAMTLDHAIGVDVETLDRPGRLLDIADSYFTPAEVALLRAAPVERQHRVFLTLWTLKESYIKAHGDGLYLPLDQFAFSLVPLRIAFSGGIVDDPANWQFDTPWSTETHIVSVAIRRVGTNPVAVRPYRMTHLDIDRMQSATMRVPASPVGQPGG